MAARRVPTVRPAASCPWGSTAAVPCRTPCAAQTGSTAVPKALPATWSTPPASPHDPRCQPELVMCGVTTRRAVPTGPRAAGSARGPGVAAHWRRPSAAPTTCTAVPRATRVTRGQAAACRTGSPPSPGCTRPRHRPGGGDVKCDDETSCPDGNTCCRLSSGAWGCCPLEQAVCCPDHVHCCPQGYTCDTGTGSCMQYGKPPQPWVHKTPAQARGGDVKCDEETSCPQGSTCCPLSLGTWGCCPLEQAICCRDHQHCCPRGYTCNEATQSCEKLLTPTPLLPAPTSTPRAPAPPRRAPTPPPARLRAPGTAAGAAVPCDATHSCRGGQRCCRGQGGFWGCCPFAQGSCCSDGRHCCPGGSRCTGRGWGCSPQRWDQPPPRRVLL
ncbi:Grn [Columba livia]|nr:Grn [Columba livia]